MKRTIWIGALVALGLSLAACASDKAAEQARIDNIDNQNCIDLGFTPGTETYGNCRLKLKEIRAQQAANDANASGVHFGLGLGVSKGF